MFTAALFPTVKKQQQPKHPLVDERINKVYYIDGMEYFSIIKSREVLTYTIVSMNLENVTLDQKSQTQKVTYRIVMVEWEARGEIKAGPSPLPFNQELNTGG